MQFTTYECKDRIAYITLNRPEKRNALNAEFVSELTACFERAEADENVKLLVLKAKGKAFCAGADLAYLQSLQKNTYAENLEDSKHLAALYKKIYGLKKLVIAQIEGHAIAGGAGLVTVCDFAFAVPEAKFGYTEVNIGFVPAIVSVFLIRKTGEGRAKELLLTGQVIEAEKAVGYGIFNETVSRTEIRDYVYDFAQKLIRNASGSSLELTKKLIADVQNYTYPDALDYAAEINAKSRATDDCKTGIAAFLNKKKPIW